MGRCIPLDSGEKMEGQPLREGCREAAYFGKSQVPDRWEVKRNSLKRTMAWGTLGLRGEVWCGRERM